MNRKTTLSLCAAIILSNSIVAQVTFDEQTSGTTQSLHSIDIVPGALVDYAWAVGSGGTILYSDDLGANWSAQASGVTATLYDLMFVNDEYGWACGSTGTIVSTQNGGTNWGLQAEGAPAAMTGIHFTTINNGIVMGDQFYALTSTGGNSWSPNASAYQIYGVDFPSSTVGYACAGSGFILKTTDGGTNWTQLTTGSTSLLQDIFFISEMEGWACGYSGTILHTTDGGANWTTQTTNTLNALSGIKFYDNLNGWACGYAGTIMHTTNGGTTWTLHTSGFTGTTLYLHYLDLISATEGIAVGENGVIIKFDNTSGTANTEEIVEIMVNIYPNPSSSSITVQTEAKIEGIEIRSVNGTLVQSETSNKISVESLTSGIYFIQVKTAEGAITKRFVKE
jgi:photosystem II stability/assembly factor-like uncharacterized protein